MAKDERGQLDAKSFEEGEVVRLGSHEYEIQELLGVGTLAEAQRARRLADNKSVVLKFLLKRLANGNDSNINIKARGDFAQEIQVLRKIATQERAAGTHLAVRLEDDGVYMDRPYQVQELAKGTPVILVSGLDELAKLRVAAQFMQLLQLAHQTDVALKDMKLDAIFWHDHSIQVIDWNGTSSGAQEIKNDLARASAIFYHLLAGEPLALETQPKTNQLEIRGQLGFGTAGWSELTRGTQQILQRALHRDHERRYQDASAYYQDLLWWSETLEFAYKHLWQDVEVRIQQANFDKRFDRIVAGLQLVQNAPSDTQERLSSLNKSAESELRKEIERPIAFGKAQLNTRGYRQAIQAFENAITVDPIRVDAYLLLAQAQLGDYFARVRDSSSSQNVLEQISKASNLILENEFDAASILLSMLPGEMSVLPEVKQFSNFNQALQLQTKAEAQNRQGKYLEALSDLREAYNIAPKAGWLRLLISQLEGDQERRAIIAERWKERLERYRSVPRTVPREAKLEILNQDEIAVREILKLDPAYQPALDALIELNKQKSNLTYYIHIRQLLDEGKFGDVPILLASVTDQPDAEELQTLLEEWSQRDAEYRALFRKATVAVNALRFTEALANLALTLDVIHKQPSLKAQDPDETEINKLLAVTINERDRNVKKQIVNTLYSLDRLDVQNAFQAIKTAQGFGPNPVANQILDQLSAIGQEIRTRQASAEQTIQARAELLNSSSEPIELRTALAVFESNWVTTLQQIGKDYSFEPIQLEKTQQRVRAILKFLNTFQDRVDSFGRIVPQLSSLDSTIRFQAATQLDRLIIDIETLQKETLGLEQERHGTVWTGDKETCAWILSQCQLRANEATTHRLNFWRHQYNSGSTSERLSAAWRLDTLDPENQPKYAQAAERYSRVIELEASCQEWYQTAPPTILSSELPDSIQRIQRLDEQVSKIAPSEERDDARQAVNRVWLELAKRVPSSNDARQILEHLVSELQPQEEKEKQAILLWRTTLDQIAGHLKSFPDPSLLDQSRCETWSQTLQDWEAQLNQANPITLKLFIHAPNLQAQAQGLRENIQEKQSQIQAINARRDVIEQELQQAEKFAQQLKFDQALEQLRSSDGLDPDLRARIETVRTIYFTLGEHWNKAMTYVQKHLWAAASAELETMTRSSFTSPPLLEFQAKVANAETIQTQLDELRLRPAIENTSELDDLAKRIIELETQTPAIASFIPSVIEFFNQQLDPLRQKHLQWVEENEKRRQVDERLARLYASSQEEEKILTFEKAKNRQLEAVRELTTQRQQNIDNLNNQLETEIEKNRKAYDGFFDLKDLS